MPLKIRCPNCEKALTVPDQLAGKTGKCPRCFKQIKILQADIPPILTFECFTGEPEGRFLSTGVFSRSPFLPSEGKEILGHLYDDSYEGKTERFQFKIEGRGYVRQVRISPLAKSPNR